MKPGLAILQNMWVRNPDKVREMFARHDEEFRIAFMERALFSGCWTGRRLKQTFGEELLGQMLFEESTREIAGDPKKVLPADEAHIEKIIATHKPKVVLAFGKISAGACFRVMQKMTFAGAITFQCCLITAPHPAARQPVTPQLLREAAAQFRKAIA